MKAMLSILGTRVLPVPSVYLTGLTNLPGHRRTKVQFEELLTGSLELARHRQEKLILYIGYLGEARQAEVLLQAMTDYADLIYEVWVDPVSGDHGRTYVPPEVVEAWPALLASAQWAFPNVTELCLFSGIDDPSQSIDLQIDAFKRRFPGLSFAVTGIGEGEQVKVILTHAGEEHSFTHPRLAQNFGGTGDVFASCFILHKHFGGMAAREAMEQAALDTLACMQKSIAAHSPDLIIEG
ncbi:MAG: hypothetical protein EAZ89_15595 [Bacteroidetes bacterium]|nr:MAG: hypothetical protein EAZ89_15595 [Bacteroidota bacterium]